MEKGPPTEAVPVTSDRSHIIAIGERLYAESIEFIREIVNNAYDADATIVDVKITEETVEVRDNGTGMDRAAMGDGPQTESSSLVVIPAGIPQHIEPMDSCEGMTARWRHSAYWHSRRRESSTRPRLILNQGV